MIINDFFKKSQVLANVMIKYEEKPINGSELIKVVQISCGQIKPIGGSKFLPFAWMTNSQEKVIPELIPKKEYS